MATPHDDHDHHDHHDHHHGADAHAPIECDDHISPESRLLEQAIRELLVEKGVFTARDIQRQIELTESRDPGVGARVVARAWVDAEFKRRLLEEPKTAMMQDFGIDLANTPELAVVENTPARHYMIVCTLCSCYPRAVLGIPPAWYKAREYRSRAVSEPRAVLAEFGTQLTEDVEVRVVDSTADLRYMVLPMRPTGSEGLTEAQLAGLVTRDSMVGVSLPLDPIAVR